MKDLGVPCREQAWEIHYAHSLLRKELCEKYGYEKEYYTREVSPYKACVYDRSANLCRNHLLAVGLITPSNQSVMEKVLQVATHYAIAPTFEIKCTKGEYTWNKEPIHSPENAYRDLTQLKKRELLYVYLNKNLYDIHIYSVTKKVTSTRYSSTTERIETTLKAYPKAMVKALIDGLCHEKINHFLNERIQLKAKIFFDLELQGEKDSKEPWEGITKYKKDTPITVEEFERRMSVAQEAVSFYQRAYEEFEKKRDRLAKGKTVQVDQEAYKKVLAYFRINAPLYINEEEDKELLHFAKLIMEDADNKRIAFEWMNPRYK
jgi:hypothetical protein